MKRGVNGAGHGRGWQRLPRILVRSYVVPTHAPSPKDTSVTTHCHAATAQLTREYQRDHRRYVLTPATTRAVHQICANHPLDNTFHIRNAAQRRFEASDGFSAAFFKGRGKRHGAQTGVGQRLIRSAVRLPLHQKRRRFHAHFVTASNDWA